MRHVHVVVVVVVVDAAGLIARLPDLGLALADALDHGVGQVVNLRWHAVGLVQHLDLAGEAQEAGNVGSGPVVNGLVVVACKKAALGAQCQLLDQPPLQTGEVLGLVDDQGLEPWQTVRLQQNVLQKVSEVQQIARLLVVPIGAFDVLKVEPLNLHLREVVVGLEVHALDAGDVDFVEDGVVGFDGKFFLAVLDGQLDAGLLGKLAIVLWRHHVLRADAQAPVGQAVQRAKPGKVSVGVEVRELLDGPLLGLCGRLLGEGKVANLGGVGFACQLLLNNAQEERRLA